MTFLTRRMVQERYPQSSAPDAVTSLCHDLKQPLAAILLVADDLADTDDNVDPRVALIQREARFMVAAVEDLLLRRLDRAVGEADVCSVVVEAVARAQLTTSCELRTVLGPDRHVALTPIALSRAVSCLLDNAIRASDGTPITTIVQDNGPRTEIVVIDHGPGLGRIPAVHGLGHRIVRSLVDPVGGELTLSPGRKEGAVATLALPRFSTRRPLDHVS